MPSEGIEPPSDCVHEHYETVYSSERHRDERRCVECGAWSPPAIEPPVVSVRDRALRILRDEMGPCNDDVNHPPQAWEWGVDALIEAGLLHE